jgi:hypothetical protein
MKVTTEAQKNASRLNGSKSKGPISLKSLDRTICARTVTLDNERSGAFKSILENYREYFRPQSQVEEALVEGLVADYWRLRRIWAIQTTALNRALPSEPAPKPAGDPPSPLRAFLNDFDHQMDRIASAHGSLISKPEFRELINREGKYQRGFDRHLANLIRLRRYFPAPETAPESSITPPELEKAPKHVGNFEI